MSKEHGNKGNVNAAKPLEEKADSVLTCRVKASDKAKWVKMAKRSEGSSKLSDWVIKTLNEAVDKELN